ncbi:hypothetical protein [Snodgrassella sp. ESL0253]|uniref:hypothetical protein n=1 Tax=Snodgrassella sp. ESL0253 TaxID=2705031 RepID=UPI001583DC84|nr:hypothetical protein [Snodgrassella sp. ESL0253]NUE66950.1 hypothetical protein [Snodgrassella sp. ESL0253]
MIIKTLYAGEKNIVALAKSCDSKADIEVELEVESKRNSAIKGFDVLFRRYCSGNRLTVEMFHEAGEYKAQRFYEFRKGRARVYCVMDPKDGSIMLLTHLLCSKSTNQTKTSDLAKAYKILTQYHKILTQYQITKIER